MKSLRLLVLLWLGFNIACSGGGGSSGGGSNPYSKISSGPSPICASPLSIPAVFGRSCSGGSNMSLCTFEDRNCNFEGSTNGICLFDSRREVSAYCTVKCDPAAAKSCPRGFACMQEGCSPNHNICVRVGQSNPTEGFVVGSEALPSFVDTYSIWAEATNAAGDRLMINSGSDVFLRKANGEWLVLDMQLPILKRMYARDIAVIDNTFYIFNSRAYESTTARDSRSVYKIEGATVSLVPMPSDFSGTLCTGNAVRGCYGEIYQLWKDSSGGLNAITLGRDRYAHHKLTANKWVLQATPGEKLELAATNSVRMDDGSYYSFSGAKLVVSDDLLNWKELPLPRNERVGGVFGFAKNDIWVTAGDMRTVFHWTGSKWIEEASLGYIENVRKVGEGQYLASAYETSYIYQASCWRRVPYVGPTAIPAGKNRAAYLADGKFQVFDLTFVPEY